MANGPRESPYSNQVEPHVSRGSSMLIQPAEDCFKKGLHALKRGRHCEALALFEAALEVERRLGGGRPQARYLSYYGLVLAIERKELHEGLQFCREAASGETFDPDVHCNLGRVLLQLGRRREAHEQFRRGLVLHPRHPGIVRALRRMGLRRRPVLPFLARSNPLNVLLGRVAIRRA